MLGILRRVIDATRWVERVWVSPLIDMAARMETSKVELIDDLGLTADRAHHYVPSSWRSLRVLSKGAVATTDVFLDYGCGKGRILWLARRFRFARIIGIELSPKLAAIARRNHTGDPRVEILAADAGSYSVPDDATHFYLFNPFPIAVVEQVLDRIDESWARRPRELTVVYLMPGSAEDAVLQHGFVEAARRRDALRFTRPADYQLPLTGHATSRQQASSPGVLVAG